MKLWLLLLLLPIGVIAYCGGRPDGHYCLYSTRRVVCQGERDMSNVVCEYGCQDGECIPAPFCTNQVDPQPMNSTFCRAALEQRAGPYHLDSRIDYNKSDQDASDLVTSLLGNTSTCLNRTILYACAVYFPDCEAWGDTCRMYAGNCEGINLNEEYCKWRQDRLLPLYVITGGVIVAIIAVGVLCFLFERRKKQEIKNVGIN